ncbi:MAG: PQQ-dependent sugar dehydrogenase [Chloroflexi bacterium]|nr:PQQ-dependent sugar dehydrogenase [Chloroflexota bacterium]
MLLATSIAAGTLAGVLASPVAATHVSLVKSGFASPVFLTHSGDSRLYVVERRGVIKVRGTDYVWRIFLNIDGRVINGGSEQGLLGLAFHPDYNNSAAWGYRRFYVNYINNSGDTQIAEYLRHKDTRNDALEGTERRLLRIDQPYSNHNGGWLGFGKDRYLYAAMGDGGSSGDPAERAQDKGSLLGKILRIIPNASTTGYTSPATNPFAGDTPGDGRIWALGLRNPWRVSHDRLTGDIWIGDVGQNRQEEIDRSLANDGGTGAGWGVNYGWDRWEGRLVYEGSGSRTGYRFPIAVYSRSNGNCAVTGGYVSRRSGATTLAGRYVFGDYCSGRIWSISAGSPDNYETPKLEYDTSYNISSFGEDASGRLYVVDLNGSVYRLNGT